VAAAICGEGTDEEHLSSTAISCSRVIAIGFSCE
jgi:hypothetical protein